MKCISDSARNDLPEKTMEYFEQHKITKDSSEKEIRRVYKKLVMKHHPDRTSGDKEVFKSIQKAYDEMLESKKTKDELKEREIDIFSKIDAFEASYQNSENEREDIIKFYKKI